MSTEADTCRKFVVPKLQASGWDSDPHSIAEQRSFTDGRIVVRGNKAERKRGKRADYLLRYTRDFPIAVTEAKAEYKKAADGLQQAKDYAQILGLKFAYATNGLEIIEFNFLTGIERPVQTFPTPAELWSRLRTGGKLEDDTAAQRLPTPANLTTGKEPRYYQRIAIDRAVQAILQGKKRVLLTMATGTGKTDVAFQICWKLWSSKWNIKVAPTRKPRILYLADRNFLVDDPKDKTFSAFGDARHKIEGGNRGQNATIEYGLVETIFLKPLREALEIPKHSFFFVPGNHDVDWTQVSKHFELGLGQDITDQNSFRQFYRTVQSGGPDIELLRKKFGSYFDFVDEYKNDRRKHKSFFYDVYEFKIGNISVGIVSLNSSWRSHQRRMQSSPATPIREFGKARHTSSRPQAKPCLSCTNTPSSPPAFVTGKTANGWILRNRLIYCLTARGRQRTGNTRPTRSQTSIHNESDV
jgi:hypothetical protein